MDEQESNVAEQTTQHSISEVVEKLCALNADNPVDWRENLNDLLLKNIDACTSDTDIEVEKESALIKELHNLNSDDKSLEWKYICLNFYYFSSLRDIFKKNPQKANFTVQQTAKLQNILRNVIAIGISSNLHPKLPYYSQLPSKVNNTESIPVLITYKRLLGTTHGFYTILTSFPHINTIIVPNFLKYILCGFYQIIHCPLMKPSDTVDPTGFKMTETIYKSLLSDRQLFQKFLTKLTSKIHPIMYFRETMMLPTKTSPTWLKNAVSSNLNECIARKNGVESLAWTMLDATEADERDDISKSWKVLHTLSKIIVGAIKLPNFQENICGQLNSLLNLRDSSGKSIKAFERLYTLCIKLLYQDDAILCQNVFIDNLLDSILCYTKPETDVLENETITESISQTMRILHFLIIEDSFITFLIPIHTIVASASVIFHIIATTLENQNLKELNDNIRDCLLKIIQESDSKFELFDKLLFDFPCKNYLELQPNINFCVKDNDLYPKRDECGIKLVLFDRAEVLQKIIANNSDIKATLFTYLLNCLVKHEKYFKRSNTELLDLEPDFILDEVSERKIVVFRLLSELAEDKTIQKHIVQNPSSFVSYLDDVLKMSIKNEVHKIVDSESEDYQIFFLVIMILQALIDDTPKKNLRYYNQVKESLNLILQECGNSELKTLIKNALSMFTGEKTREHTFNDNDNNSTSKTELDKAIEDVCDPLLPVRGHGLMTLTKLIREKDKNALERKRYICNIFQNTLKDTDSFIYLNAIGGLATMGDIFPDTVLNVLTEEYTDFSRHTFENNQEIRLKLGEVLVRITKLLGEMAPKYKALLLNTFLYGIKDDDYLIRASSLSNLGEICGVLGYKLGTTISEVLVAIHAIIATDKAPEARRAAVTVLRQLFVGLEKEMIVFLKDDILPVYRTLKMIYTNDSDDIMRLQAQLALEQLNENMKDFVLPLMGLNTVNNRFVLPENDINIRFK